MALYTNRRWHRFAKLESKDISMHCTKIPLRQILFSGFSVNIRFFKTQVQKNRPRVDDWCITVHHTQVCMYVVISRKKKEGSTYRRWSIIPSRLEEEGA